jgi:hypothetical protein
VVIRQDAFLCSSKRPPTAYLDESTAMEGSSVLSSVPSSRCLCRSCELHAPRSKVFDLTSVWSLYQWQRIVERNRSAMQPGFAVLGANRTRIAAGKSSAGQHGFCLHDHATPHHTILFFPIYLVARCEEGRPEPGCWVLGVGC